MASKSKTITGTLEWVERLGSSRNGNPRFAVTVDDTEFRTQIDGSVGYEVSNHRVGSEITLVLGARSAVVDMRPATREDRIRAIIADTEAHDMPKAGALAAILAVLDE